MKEQFVSYEIAIQLKEKGFDEPCIAAYVPKMNKEFKLVGCGALYFEVDGLHVNSAMLHGEIAAPLYQQVTDWLRWRHHLIITIELDQTSYMKFAISIVKWVGICQFEEINLPFDKWGLYRNYNEALAVAIEQSLNLIQDL